MRTNGTRDSMMEGCPRPASPSSSPTTTSSCARASRPCSRSSPTSRSSGRRPTTTSSSPAPTRPRPRCSSPTSACRRTSSSEGIDAAKEIRKRHPGTGVVVLSQFDDPEYAVALLADGAAGYAYLLKDRVAEGDQLARAVREVATGGSVLDPKIVEALVKPHTSDGDLTPAEEDLLRFVAEGKPMKAIAAAQHTTPAAVNEAVEALFLKLSQGATAGTAGSLRRLRMLHESIVDREEQGETAESAPADRAGRQGAARGRPHRRDRGARGHRADVRRAGLLGDRRARRPVGARRPAQRAPGRDEPRDPRSRRHRDAVRRRRGDGLLRRAGRRRPTTPTVPSPPRSRCSCAGRAQRAVGGRRVVRRSGSASALSTGPVAAALLGSEERLEYTLVGDTVNLSQRLQDLARPAGRIVMSEATYLALTTPPANCDAARRPAGEGSRDPGRRLPRSTCVGHDVRRDAPSRPAAALRSVMSTTETVVVTRGLRKTFESEGRAGARAARRRLHHAARRVRRRDGPVGVREVDAAQPRRRPRRRRPTARSRWRGSRSWARPRTSSRSCAAATSGSCSSSSTCSRA